eukprot:TRINITY_DN1039_c0_g1_i1.p1 TRINITY_DN1039_c0_g1~~TRINITY_DN1039_c0_g1_i1.p1  ORF type:complete len:211 (-),score=65.96 TRINITY_DN1039_c0_g1_i1:54-686(-)
MEDKEKEVEGPEERECAVCDKKGVGFPKCSRCKEVFYCSRDCQKKDWATHKSNCIKPEDRPKPPSEDDVVGFVECESFKDCRDWLITHPQIITKEISDEMFQKGYLALKTHPVQIGTRFIRNAQILQYLLDIRKASGGQQDISLFFARILDENNAEYRNSFNKEYQDLVKRILNRIKEKEAQEKLKEEQGGNQQEEQEEEQQTTNLDQPE